MIYWTSLSPSSIHKAAMDGTRPITIVTDLIVPSGLAVDFAAKRLYWTDMKADTIQTSDLDGRGARTAVQLPAGWKFLIPSTRKND